MNNQDIIEDVKNGIKTRLLSLKKVFIIYEFFAFFLGIIYGYMTNGVISGIVTCTLFIPLAILLIYFLFVFFWLPSTVAKKRGHTYTNLIQLLNVAGLFTGITWFIAAAWAIFPSEKSLIDPLVGNPTGLGRRNIGDTIGAAQRGTVRGNEFERDSDKQINRLIDMLEKGLITDDEFSRKKREIIQRDC